MAPSYASTLLAPGPQFAPTAGVMSSKRYRPISDYAIIGDCHSIALISSDGSIDWACLPHFDSAALFCRLLDHNQGGFWQLAPLGSPRVERQYREGTNILETTYFTPEGVVRVIDLMPIEHRHRDLPPGAVQGEGQDVATRNQILRVIEGVSGRVTMDLALAPRFQYATVRPRIELAEGAGAIAWGQGEALTLAAPVPLAVGEDQITARFTVHAGATVSLELTWDDDPQASYAYLRPPAAAQQIAFTENYWRHWSQRATYHGPYREQVVRSALTLKLMTFEPTGAIVAAPTTSLPEEIGGVRNWDYRYTWLRDSAFTLYALIVLGYLGEARDFLGWLRQTVQTNEVARLQPLYRLNGQADIPEYTLDHLEGYRGSRPVRVGNDAAAQRQLDCYGVVVDTAYLFRLQGGPQRFGLNWHGESETWEYMRAVVEQACQNWQLPDAGIWEVRGGERHFVYSKVMCWVAVDRGIKLARSLGLGADLDRWRRIRQQIREEICARGFNAQVGAFTQSYDSEALDAANLLMPLVGFMPVSEPRMRATIERIADKLTVDGLVYRYLDADDGLPGGEGTFSICTFWLIDCLCLLGQVETAHKLYRQMLGYASPLGLYAEEIEPHTGQHLGNYPQALTHIALINSALHLTAAEQRGGRALFGSTEQRLRVVARSQ